MKKHQLVTVYVKIRPNLLEDAVANLVAECRGIIEDRLTKALSAVSGEVLAEQLWQGRIEPRNIQQALLGLEKLQAFLSGLSVELSGLAAGVFQRPVLLHTAAGQEGLPAGEALVLGEQLAWCRETNILNKTLMEACQLVWNRAAGDCAWPVRRLKPGKLLWRWAGAATPDEERRCLQELTRSVEGVRVNMQKRLCRTISIQVAAQIWSIYDRVSQERSNEDLMDPETNYCA